MVVILKDDHPESREIAEKIQFFLGERNIVSALREKKLDGQNRLMIFFLAGPIEGRDKKRKLAFEIISIFPENLKAIALIPSPYKLSSNPMNWEFLDLLEVFSESA